MLEERAGRPCPRLSLVIHLPKLAGGSYQAYLPLLPLPGIRSRILKLLLVAIVLVVCALPQLSLRQYWQLGSGYPPQSAQVEPVLPLPEQDSSRAPVQPALTAPLCIAAGVCSKPRSVPCASHEPSVAVPASDDSRPGWRSGNDRAAAPAQWKLVQLGGGQKCCRALPHRERMQTLK